MKTKLVVTGATGFIGSALLGKLQQKNNGVSIGVCRVLPRGDSTVGGLVASGDLETANIESVLNGAKVVVHTAARAHVVDSDPELALAEFRRVNVEGSLNVARQAAQAGVRRFVFLSSIGVNGGSTNSVPFTESSTPKPHTPYAQSKLEAEQALRILCAETKMELVIIRPTLVYAAHAPGNFATLLKVVDKRIPLPFGRVNNRRSFIYLENLLDFIIVCMNNPAAANRVFVVADDQAISTAELLRLLSSGMGKKALLVPFPLSLMRFGAAVLGRSNMYEQLCSSLEVDASKARELLNWTPPYTVDEAMRKTARAFLETQ